MIEFVNCNGSIKFVLKIIKKNGMANLYNCYYAVVVVVPINSNDSMFIAHSYTNARILSLNGVA